MNWLNPVSRTEQEAWDLALDNKAMVMGLLYKYVNSHSLPWYKGDALQAELESFAWEGMLEACIKWDESKGALSTFAYPCVTNAMNARMKVLMRMGTKLSGGGFKKGEKGIRPILNSLEGHRANAEAEEITEPLEDLGHNAFMPEPEPLMEDVIIDELRTKALMAKIEKELVALEALGPEPYAQVLRLMYLTEPTHERLNGGRSLGSGLTLEEVGRKLGLSTTTVKTLHDEALYWLQQRLLATGEEYE